MTVHFLPVGPLKRIICGTGVSSPDQYARDPRCVRCRKCRAVLRCGDQKPIRWRTFCEAKLRPEVVASEARAG